MNKLLICLALLFCSPLFLSAQQKKIDSVEALLKTDKEDTNKVNHLNLLGVYYGNSGEAKKEMELENEAIALARKSDYIKGIASANKNLGYVYCDEGNYTQSLDYFTQALKIFQQEGNKIYEASTLIGMGIDYSSFGNTNKALEYYNEAIKISEKINYKTLEANALGDMGIAYHQQGNYPKSLEYYMKTIQIEEDLHNETGVMIGLMNIGTVYQEMGDYEMALSYDKQCLKKADSSKAKLMQANTLNNIGEIYWNLKKFPDAIDYISQSLKINQANGNQSGIAINIGNLGAIYNDQGDITKALEYYAQAYKIDSSMGDTIRMAGVLGNTGESYTRLKDYKLAEDYVLKALAVIHNSHDISLEKSFYLDLCDIYYNTGQYQKAYLYHIKYSSAKDSIFNKDRSKEIGKLEAKYQYDKDSAIQQAKFTNAFAIQQAETEKKSAESKTEKVIIWLIASVAGILILLVVLIFQRMKGVEKKKLIAEQQKAWLELKALRTQMNPHFLYNTLNSIQNFVLKNDSKASSRYLSQFAGLMRSVLENSRKDKITLAEEIEGLSNYIDFEVMRFPKKFNYDIQVDSSLDKAKTELPPLLIQPYVENAIWHGLMHLEERAGRLNILFEKVGYQLKCTVDDNGIGRQAATALKKQSVHKSVGLSIVAERMESMNKMYHWEMKTEIIDKFSENGTSDGTRAELFLPLIINAVAYA